MSYVATLLVGVVVIILVYGTISLVLLWFSSVFVVPSKRLPLLPSIFALIIAWVASWPVAGLLIENTFLSALPWGHAGELFVLPYILADAGVVRCCFSGRSPSAREGASCVGSKHREN